MGFAVHILGRFRDAVFHEIFDRGETGGALEAAAAFALADQDGAGDVIQRDRFHKVIMDIEHRLLRPLRILVDGARREPGVRVCPGWVLVLQQIPQLQDTGL